MSNHALLDNITHKDLKIIPGYRKGQGFEVNVTRVFPSEFARLQTEYPLFFVKNAESGHFDAVALLGFYEGQNLFLGEDGWLSSYVPLSVQRQPFLIGFQQSTEDGVPVREPVVHIDLDNPRVSTTEGAPVFLPHGGESPLLEGVTSVLKAIHDGHEASENLSTLLVGLELIESLDLGVTFRDGNKHSVSGLYTINEDRLRELNGAALEVLHKPGHVQDIYMFLSSLPNVNKLIDRV
ncbi:MAG: hypothetical protein ACI87W_001579 [Halieaceae bacterium]|jgi:hypothetical protein